LKRCWQTSMGHKTSFLYNLTILLQKYCSICSNNCTGERTIEILMLDLKFTNRAIHLSPCRYDAIIVLVLVLVLDPFLFVLHKRHLPITRTSTRTTTSTKYNFQFRLVQVQVLCPYSFFAPSRLIGWTFTNDLKSQHFYDDKGDVVTLL
jgi:hypothetical protein